MARSRPLDHCFRSRDKKPACTVQSPGLLIKFNPFAQYPATSHPPRAFHASSIRYTGSSVFSHRKF
ncbi:uncharacterized protein An16g00570 [Aspergillus niger]|uniref:Contig An16c0020, genomic contig n=2 Tax=Aspergillus niger TaxID=5061 RepID=A2R6M9_ASPNC|nr:uncharacterized protein An16g00570 [Aspergillus niger]CAK46744.1 unnamed protein product [Aspergillus niger]